MKCPKCEEGKLTKIKFKELDKIAYICEFCGDIWYEKEAINQFGGHTFDSQLNKDKEEYSFDDTELNQEAESIMYSEYK